MRRFEFVDGTSNKFWEAKTEGPKLLVRFGRIGGTWQESDKLLANAEKANAEMEKLIREKTRKGYLEVGGKPEVKVLAKTVAKKAKTKEPKPQSMEATISPAERKAKAQKVLLMFADGQWELAHNILEIAQDEEWLFEQLLNGCKIEDGKLIPSKAIKKAIKKDVKSSPVLAMLNIMLCIPHGSKLLKTFKFEKLKELDFGAVKGEEMTPWIVHAFRLLPRSEITVDLRGLESLSDAAANSLSKHTGELYLDELKSLSDSPGHVALARKLASQKGELRLGLKSPSDAAAEALSKHRGDLYFWHLESLSDSPGHVALARKLASQKTLNLGWLESLGDAAAEALSKHKGDLELQGLKSLSDAAAEALSKCKGDLNLGGLASLSDCPAHVALAEKLASQKGDLWLEGLTSLSDVAAESLGKYKGELWLNALESLSDIAAEALSKIKGDLWLNGLESLSDIAAEALSKIKGQLWLRGLKSLSDIATEALGKHKGGLYLSDSLEQKFEKYKNQSRKK